MSKSTITSLVSLVVIVIAVILIVILVPGKNNNGTKKSSNSFTAQQKNTATNEIKNNVKTFFAVNTSMATRVNLLQNGSQFAKPMEAEFSQLDNQKPSVIVNSINFTNQSNATINYTVELNGQPVLKNQNGTVLYINKTWKVSDSTLCQLLSMDGYTPSVCTSVH